MKKQLLILIALCISVIGYSQTFTALDTNGNTLEFNITSPTTVEVKDYISGNGDVLIPPTVSNGGTTYSITAIGNLAFFQDGITSAIIPNSVTSIKLAAFQQNSLASFIIPDNVTSIANNAFFQNQLSSIIIPDSVLSIGNLAFSGNSIQDLTIGNNVTTIGTQAFLGNPMNCVTIPSSVTTIGPGAFVGCSNVISLSTVPPTINTAPGNGATDTFSGDRSNVSLTIPTGTASAYAAATWTGFNSVSEGFGNIFSIDNIDYVITSGTNNEVFVYDYNTDGGSIVDIPATVVSSCTSYSVIGIFNNAFENKNLTQVTMPNSILSIGVEAFRDNSLTNVVMSENTNVIGVSAFLNNQLSSIVIPDSVTIIGPNAFAANQLQNVIIPNNVTTIGSNAFANNQLVSVTLGNSLTTIENQAFLNNLITNIVIPNSVTDFGVRAFQSNLLTSVTISNNVTSIGEDSFRFNQITSVTIPDGVLSIGPDAFSGNVITSVSLPNSLTSISTGAFENNQLTSVTIPQNMAAMGNRVFANNPLTDVYTQNLTPPTITTGGALDTFNQIRNNIHLHIPAGTLGAYVTDPGALWINFNPVTEDALSTEEFELADTIKVITTTGNVSIIASNQIQLQKYTIYSCSGAEVAEGDTSEISTATLSNGLYILKLDFDKGTAIKKIIIN